MIDRAGCRNISPEVLRNCVPTLTLPEQLNSTGLLMPDNRTQKNRPATIDKELVQKLREMSGEGMMACMKALHWAKGDLEEANEYLRRSGNLVAIRSTPLNR